MYALFSCMIYNISDNCVYRESFPLGARCLRKLLYSRLWDLRNKRDVVGLWTFFFSFLAVEQREYTCRAFALFFFFHRCSSELLLWWKGSAHECVMGIRGDLEKKNKQTTSHDVFMSAFWRMLFCTRVFVVLWSREKKKNRRVYLFFFLYRNTTMMKFSPRIRIR